MDLKIGEEPTRVRERICPQWELWTSRTEDIGGIISILWQISLISLNLCKHIKQKEKKNTTVSEMKWNFKNPNVNLNYVTNSMPWKQKNSWEIWF